MLGRLTPVSPYNNRQQLIRIRQREATIVRSRRLTSKSGSERNECSNKMISCAHAHSAAKMSPFFVACDQHEACPCRRFLSQLLSCKVESYTAEDGKQAARLLIHPSEGADLYVEVAGISGQLQMLLYDQKVAPGSPDSECQLFVDPAAVEKYCGVKEIAFNFPIFISHMKEFGRPFGCIDGNGQADQMTQHVALFTSHEQLNPRISSRTNHQLFSEKYWNTLPARESVAFVSNIVSLFIILRKPEVLHFSFLLILAEVLVCGIVKLIIRSLIAIDFDVNLYLFDFEMIFDFGILAFTFLMSLNRFVLIIFPKRPLLNEKKPVSHTSSVYLEHHDSRGVQFVLSSLVWTISIAGSVGFFIGRCERRMLDDGTFTDVCPRSLGYSPSGSIFAEYWDSPALYDAAQTIRDIIGRCYDILPLLAFVIYLVITALIIKRKSALSSTRKRSDFKLLAQGGAVLFVYGMSSIINLLLTENYGLIRSIPSPAMQFLLFLYISIDILTVALIPLSIVLTVPALRQAPKELYSSWLSRSRSRALARKTVAKWRAKPVAPTVRRQTEFPLSIERKSSDVVRS